MLFLEFTCDLGTAVCRVCCVNPNPNHCILCICI